VMLDEAVTAGHPPEAGIVFVIVYVPGLLAERFTCPVEALINTRLPEDALNTPATPPPLNVGDGLATPWQ
jgi:hypothetical protein